MNVVLILPTYNERDTILILLEEAMKEFASFPHHTFSYLVVDDTSPDGTADAVREFAKKHKNIHILLGKKEGLGKALLRGMTFAVEKLNADILVQMDADLSHDPKSLPKFIHAIDSGADIAIGCRYIKGGSIPEDWGLNRKIYSVVGNSFVRIGLGYLKIHDWTGGYRAFSRKYYELNKEKVKKYTGYLFQIAFLHNSIKEGAKIHEVPIHFTDRRFGHSKIATREYIISIFKYVINHRIEALNSGPFKKFAVVGLIGFIINTVVLEVCIHLLGIIPAIGSIIGAEFAIISNFFLNNSWTFKEKQIEKGKTLQKFIQFNTAAIGAIVIQAGTVFLGTHLLGTESYRIFYIMGVGLGLIWNYFMYSKVIWK